VVLVPPQHVKPYVQRTKTDAADAAAICEAMSRPQLAGKFVPVKSAQQQGAQTLASGPVRTFASPRGTLRSKCPNYRDHDQLIDSREAFEFDI
jgi:transposase